jgi:hypothetical protein
MNTRSAQHRRDEDGSRGTSRRQALWAIAIATIGGLGGGVAWRAARPASPDPSPSTATIGPRLEWRPTLEPAAFTGKARRAYEVARQIPDLLDHLKCYCRCEPYGHRSLLSCYTDNHAST